MYKTYHQNDKLVGSDKEWASKCKLVKSAALNGTINTVYWSLPNLRQNQILLATCNNFRVICYSRNETNSDLSK